MKKNKIKLVFVLFFCLLFSLPAFAHGGRTDSNGGHRDNNNVSGLGYYHFHCGGYPPHLHEDGVCPYAYSNSVETYSSKLKEKEPVYTEYNSAGRKTFMPFTENTEVIFFLFDCGRLRINYFNMRTSTHLNISFLRKLWFLLDLDTK